MIYHHLALPLAQILVRNVLPSKFHLFTLGGNRRWQQFVFSTTYRDGEWAAQVVYMYIGGDLTVPFFDLLVHSVISNVTNPQLLQTRLVLTAPCFFAYLF